MKAPPQRTKSSALETAPFARKTIDELTVEDERSFRHVALYADLKTVVERAKIAFRVLPSAGSPRDDEALFLNLTFWDPASGGDVLSSETIPADVVAHVAWHHLAASSLVDVSGAGDGPRARPSIDALALGESIASAFDLYLVGRLLGHAPSSTFLESQVPAMADAAEAAGLDERGFERMLEGIAEDPERAFSDLRELLFDATTTLVACTTLEDAARALAGFRSHRFASLLHRYELSNWVLYARIYGDSSPDTRAREVDHRLRAGGAALEWLCERWVAPAIA